MWNKLSYILIGCTVLFSSINSQVTWAKDVEADIKSTGKLKVGIRQDSPLFGFAEEKRGYCQDFAQNVAKQLSNDYGQKIELELVQSTTQNRWALVTDGIVHFECGPNSINETQLARYNVVFSLPFFITATQILAKTNTTESQLRQGTIGIIAGTSNAEDIENLYSVTQVDDSYTRRSHGVADVQIGNIEGFASDGILLIGTVSQMNLPLEDYNLITPVVDNRPFCSAYGMILPDGEENQQWREKINQLIVTTDTNNMTWRKWFGELSPYFEAVTQVCQ